MMSTVTNAETMTPATPVEYFRKDYKKPDYSTSDIFLSFDLAFDKTIVTTTSTVLPNFDASGEVPNLVLDGEELQLLEVKINDVVIPAGQYEVVGDTLVISGLAGVDMKSGSFQLETKVQISPETNFQLSGLYKSGSNLLCTQCEAMGFRRITYHQDRPDVLSKYKVRLEGDEAAYPLLLSNGNNIDGGKLQDGRHWALWEDPFPKPSYLFALVAGSLGSIHSEYTTTSGRKVALGIFSDKENVAKLDHAMYSLKESMKWDEDTFGLECDLDVYNVVATNDFNMGAMENKGLNIFNSAYVLADPKTATDTDYERILGVIGHEYFHNWSGNRVTVRDWFQLTLKEGLTVFRDQWFTSDLCSTTVKRVEDVRMLRSRQFPEDQGPMSHPIRPESYISMDNFYTGTVYVKGAEVVRMYRTLLGADGFKKGLKLYFERHDGSAVTCDDFRFAMQDANNVDLTQFERWYAQAGTPIVDVSENYDAATKTYTLTLKQHTPATPGQAESDKLPLLIPVVVGLIGRESGAELVPSTVLKLTEAEQTFKFEDVAEPPIASLLRDFSAPVKLNYALSDQDLAFMMAHDTDSFNKWDASNRLSSSVILNLASKSVEDIKASTLPADYVEAVRAVLRASLEDPAADKSLVAYALQLPDETTLMQEMPVVAIDSLHAARGHVKATLGSLLKAEFEAIHKANTAAPTSEFKFNPEEVARRRLQNTALDFLASEKSAESAKRSKTQFDCANCMTDKLAALACLASQPCAEREAALQAFHTDAGGDALVLNKWFAIQAMADLPDLLSRVKELKSHPDFLLSNPNRARSLISTFAANNVHFHATDGEGYKFIADCVMDIDALNPQVAARLAQAFSQWKRFDADRQCLMKEQLQRVKDKQGLSKDTFEVVSRCLK